MDKAAQEAQAIDHLINRDHIQIDERVFVVLRHTSKPGMMRTFDFFLIRENKPVCITWSVAKALDYPFNVLHNSLEVRGADQDMEGGYSVVTALAYKLFGDGNRLGYVKL